MKETKFEKTKEHWDGKRHFVTYRGKRIAVVVGHYCDYHHIITSSIVSVYQEGKHIRTKVFRMSDSGTGFYTYMRSFFVRRVV